MVIFTLNQMIFQVAGACGAVSPLFLSQRTQRRKGRKGKKEGEESNR